MVAKSKEVRTGERIRQPESLIGRVLFGAYPSHNYYGIRLRYELRRVLIQTVRLIREKPIEAKTREAEPALRRFGVLVGGLDLDKGETRHFYLGAFKSWLLRDPTPEVLYPDLCAKRTDGKVSKLFYLPDPRRFHAEMWAEDERPMRVYPVASATCRASRSCLSE